MWHSLKYRLHKLLFISQARRQDFPEGGSSTRVALKAGGLGYLEQNPEI